MIKGLLLGAGSVAVGIAVYKVVDAQKIGASVPVVGPYMPYVAGGVAGAGAGMLLRRLIGA